jgi:hypothetical protein
MKIKKILLAFVAFALLITAIPQTSVAQWSLGASYEIRNQNPENGFGVRLEREILKKVPIINLGLRGHFSYFSEDNYVNENDVNIGDIVTYDYGIAATAGFSLGLLSPYVGTGLGAQTLDIDETDNNIFWNGFVGAKVSPLPVIKPFVEYRFQSAESFEALVDGASTSDIRDGNTGRLIFGVSLSF